MGEDIIDLLRLGLPEAVARIRVMSLAWRDRRALAVI